MGLSLEKALAKVTGLYDRLAGRRGDIERHNRYFRGEQPLVYASKEWKEFHKGRFGDFADNWCGVVGNSPSERIRMDGFRISEDGKALSRAEKQLARDWSINEMEAQSSQGFLQSIIAKRSAVIVWGNNDDEPEITWEHPSQVIVEYDGATGRRRRFALKAWIEGDLELATLYTPDELWKFQRNRLAATVTQVDGAAQTNSGLILPTSFTPLGASAGWEPRENTGDDQWPLPNPLGLLPVVEFSNRPMLGGEPMSDIAGTIAMQDAINLLWAYLFGAADFASLPGRVVMGQGPPMVPILDANGQKVGEKPVSVDELTKGRLLYLQAAGAKIGQFDSADLKVFTDAINVAVRHVAAQTRTPVHYIVGELSNVNGETLLAGETGLVKKIEEFHLFATPPVREVHRLMALVRNNRGLAEKCRTGRVVWADAETRTTAQASDAALKDKSIGLPLAWIAEKRFGLSPAEVERMLEMRKAELADPEMQEVLRAVAAQPADARA